MHHRKEEWPEEHYYAKVGKELHRGYTKWERHDRRGARKTQVNSSIQTALHNSNLTSCIAACKWEY